MQDKLVQQDVHDFFQKLTDDVHEIILQAPTLQIANEQIASKVGINVANACEGYANDLYYDLTKQVKKEDFFQDVNHLNAFYDLNLKKKIREKYHFEVNANELKMDPQKANTIYQGLGAAAGTMAVGGILKYALASMVTVPVWLVVAASLLSGVGTYQMKTRENREAYLNAIDAFLANLEREVLDWLTDIENYYHQQVQSLYTNDKDI